MVSISISLLCNIIEAQLNEGMSISEPIDDSCLQLVHDVLHLAIIGKNQNTIVCLLHTLELFLKLTIFNELTPDTQLVKNLRSLVWMLVCSDSTQVQIDAGKAFVCGLNLFYPEAKEKSALLMVLLTEKESIGAMRLQEMLLTELAWQLNTTSTSCRQI